MKPELEKRFTLLLRDGGVVVYSTTHYTVFKASISTKHPIKIGWHDYIETPTGALNYYQLQGILILFGVAIPSFHDLIGSEILKK